ncbi:hypothetical protein [Paracoccus salsus]|uniref:hypothetical protein n=1 Tax=Paracoccus salsus TaxID=2911061 RepID=UPI001F4892DE|nr:hypothetical protein [Paracoccus salsus]MCF3973983.1 hypothetical protein [Paracoccus salsus]
MSVLEIPRIYFKGDIAWDPVTTNNYPKNSAPAAYDEKASEAILNTTAVDGGTVAAFRKAAIDEVVSVGNWNPHGSYRSPFFNTSITGVDTGSGLDTRDPFVSAPVDFVGMLVDAEPYGAFSSQLFFDDISFGIGGGCQVFGKRKQHFTDRYINFQANPNNSMIAGIASVLWQTCFPKNEGLRIDSFDSPALAALDTLMAEDDVLGVMVRFCTYRTVYYDDPTLSNGSPAMQAAGAALQAKLNAGGFQPNPARSKLVGTLGLWRRCDAVHEPGDRALLTTAQPITQGMPAKHPAVCGTAFARVADDRITLDLSNCIPARNRDAEKVDLGDLKLIAADPAPAVAITEIATIPYSRYDQAAFEATSGIVDIPLAPGVAKSLAGMNLSVSAGGKTYLEEAPLRAISDKPNCYLDEGSPGEATVQVYERGVPAGAGIDVTLSELGASQPTALSLKTDSSGQVTFPLSASAGNVTGLVLQPGPDPTLPVTVNSFNVLRSTYMYLRVLPADDDIAALPPTWQNVHDHVLSNWEAMAPCMDNWLRLGDEAQVRSYGPLIKKLTDPANFEDFRFMPVTRDLTQGQRRLLYNFLDGAAGMAAAGEAEKDAAPEPNYHALSRAMRST